MTAARAHGCPRLGIALALLLSAAPGMAQAAEETLGQTSDGGIALRWTFSQNEGKAGAGLGVLDVYVSDTASGAPVRYQNGALLGWMQRDRGGLIEESRTCAERIRALATQGVGRRSDVDLNRYRIVSLNSDGTVAFINPFVGFNNAKLEAIVDLASEPLDWVQDRDRMELWVLLKGPLRLVSIDLHSATVTRTVRLPDEGGARRLAVEPASRTLWTGLPGTGQIASVALDDPQPLPTLLDAPGLADILATPDGGTVSWLDDKHVLRFLGRSVGRPERVLPDEAIALDHSANARLTVVALAGGMLRLLPDGQDAATPGLAAMFLPHGLKALRMLDGGRRLLAVGDGRASLVDLATRQVVLSLATQPGADRIAVTDRFAYALGGPSGHATMYALDDLKAGRNQALDVMVSSPDAGKDPSVASRVAVAPEGNGLLVASPGDGMIYQYSEGMMAPVGSYSNYRRAAVGLNIVDDAFREVGAGHYRTTVRTGKGGRYDLLVGAVAPRLSSCSTVVVRGGDTDTGETAHLRAELMAADGTADTPDAAVAPIRVRLTEALPGHEPGPLTGLADLVLLVFDKHSGWQRRVSLRDMGGGQYEAHLKLPRKARYDFLVSSASANLSFAEGQMGETLMGPTP